jgi:1,2-diacylglycerol 3-alpha-glucosyltransferase
VSEAPLRVFVACGGVGIASRGFETVARESFEALSGSDELELTLVKGRGERAPGERVAPTLSRDTRTAALVGRVLRRPPFWIEQACFTATMLPLLAARRPDVVSEWWVSRYLARVRQAWPAGFKILLSNGGPYPPDLLRHADFVHQLTPYAFEEALQAGVPRERQALLELGVKMGPDQPAASGEERRSLRGRLGLPADRPLVLAVAALSFFHKRLDYLVREVAALPPPRPHLLMLGQHEPETPLLLELADSLLGRDGYTVRTVPKAEVAEHYRAADVFAHASLWEAFGLVMVEALSHGLPCVVHDGPTQGFLLDGHGFLGDLSRDRELAALLARALAGDDMAERERRRRYARDRFSWERLAPRYAEMMRAAATSEPHIGRA